MLGIVEGDWTGRTVALRADMDALPIQEENDHDFVSENEGVDIDEAALTIGTELMAQIAIDTLYELIDERPGG